MRDAIYGKYDVHGMGRGEQNAPGPFFILRMGDPHADAAIDTDPALALALHDRYCVTKAGTDGPFLTGCVPCPILSEWRTDVHHGIRAMLLRYARHVVNEAPTLSASIMRAIGWSARCSDQEINESCILRMPDDSDNFDPGEHDEWQALGNARERETRAARERVATIRAQRLAEKSTP